MGIKPVGAASRSSEPWSEGAWEIYLYGPLSCSYYIDISSTGKITNAYDESYLGLLLNVKSDSSGSLNAKISGANLVVSNNIY